MMEQTLNKILSNFTLDGCIDNFKNNSYICEFNESEIKLYYIVETNLEHNIHRVIHLIKCCLCDLDHFYLERKNSLYNISNVRISHFEKRCGYIDIEDSLILNPENNIVGFGLPLEEYNLNNDFEIEDDYVCYNTGILYQKKVIDTYEQDKLWDFITKNEMETFILNNQIFG